MTELPKCESYDTVMVVVDRFTKMSHFTPCTTAITAEQTAGLYIDRVFRHHGAPKEIITDRGVQFDSKFMKSFWARLGTDQKMSTAFHPETDGQTERVNSILNQYLRAYTTYKQDNWVSLLSLAEYAYNNAIHSATGVTPFYANTGMHPSSGHNEGKTVSDDPNALAHHMAQLESFLCSNLEVARSDMKRFADVHRREPPKYEIGDKVMLSTANIRTTRPKTKWSDKWIGPYRVISVHADGASFKLELPPSMKTHPIFHTSLLKPYMQSTIPDRVQDPASPVIIDDHKEYEVEKILDHRTRYGSDEYLVRWKTYGREHDSWTKVRNMPRSQESIDDYHEQHPRSIPSKGKRRRTK